MYSYIYIFCSLEDEYFTDDDVNYDNDCNNEDCTDYARVNNSDCDNEESVDDNDDMRDEDCELDDEEDEDDDLYDEYDDDENDFASMKIFHGSDSVIDTSRVEKIPAKEPKFFAVPLKSALKKPSTPTQDQSSEISAVSVG